MVCQVLVLIEENLLKEVSERESIQVGITVKGIKG